MSTTTDNELFGSDAERALGKLMTRLTDVRNGFEKLVSEAQEDFEPVAREFLDLHAKHVDQLRNTLKEHGFDISDSGSFMSQVNEAVVAARAYFDDIDQDVMAQVRNGEQKVLNAFDDAVNKVESSDLTARLQEMRNELRDCVERTRHMG